MCLIWCTGANTSVYLKCLFNLVHWYHKHLVHWCHTTSPPRLVQTLVCKCLFNLVHWHYKHLVHWCHTMSLESGALVSHRCFRPIWCKHWCERWCDLLLVKYYVIVQYVFAALFMNSFWWRAMHNRCTLWADMCWHNIGHSSHTQTNPKHNIGPKPIQSNKAQVPD